MKKETVLFATVALIVGLLVGILVTKGGKNSTPTAQAPAAAPAAGMQQNITLLEGMVASQPENRNAWVQLGNAYFDTNQPMKSIEAYDKALAINADDPNVLTDQGVMFRAVGWYDRAVENFSKAYELSPNHLQSLFNLGIVYRYDLQDFAKAKEAWEIYPSLNPSGPQAEQVRRDMAFLDSHPPLPEGMENPVPAKP